MAKLRNTTSVSCEGVHFVPPTQLIEDAAEYNPVSSKYVPACKSDKPREILQYMITEQQRHFGHTILDTGNLSYPILTRNLKLHIKNFGLFNVKRAIDLALYYTNNPFSIKFVGSILKDDNNRHYFRSKES